MKYKEGFSRTLVRYLLDEYEPTHVLDPFAGIGTTVLTAAGEGVRATGVEIMPVGVLVGTGIAEAANGMTKDTLLAAARSLDERLLAKRPAPKMHAFPHVKITERAFPGATEKEIAKAREHLADMADGPVKTLLNVACMTVLEAVSYTRKDGQYLRWDHRSGRQLRGRMTKGDIPSFRQAVAQRLDRMAFDLDDVTTLFGRGHSELLTGSSLELLRTLPDASVDLVITSPPYANRYDYTRTYALELAWLGFGQEDFCRLRQQLLSATVENRSKIGELRRWYEDAPGFIDAVVAKYGSQEALHEVLDILRAHAHELGNRHVIRLLEGYFLEMTLIIAELARLVERGGHVIMVNDNVQYHGEEVPVDLILADVAEHFGFNCENIWKLARGKGNASQQMGRYGRREIRKCVYQWTRV